ncbi:Uncharacterized protein OBRU01_07555 [Operophtera brumata]|uniref:Reverse transcriptase and recombinase n=1 Tax=Operophtera brumata TaxID=104452 RepID=A0A0L7LJC7_OPEBR|nr:Uncharacterized protein OBRU01_07555 [Operophtera brumata]
MPKRSAQSQIERYARKIRKIEDNEKRRRRILSPLDSSSDDEGNEDPGRTLGNNNEAITGSTPAVAQTLGQDEELESADNAIPNEDLAGPSNQEETDGSAAPDLDPELLSALGESTSDTPDYGENIHDNLSRLWLPLLKKGMPKENKDKLLNEYVIPDNCRLLQAPNLNAEISAAVPDMVRNRDKTLKATQQQLGSGITAINRAIDLLLKSDNKVQAMKHLSNGCRLLCDSHYTATQNRIKLVAPSLDKSFLHMISRFSINIQPGKLERASSLPGEQGGAGRLQKDADDVSNSPSLHTVGTAATTGSEPGQAPCSGSKSLKAQDPVHPAKVSVPAVHGVDDSWEEKTQGREEDCSDETDD